MTASTFEEFWFIRHSFAHFPGLEFEFSSLSERKCISTVLWWKWGSCFAFFSFLLISYCLMWSLTKGVHMQQSAWNCLRSNHESGTCNLKCKYQRGCFQKFVCSKRYIYKKLLAQTLSGYPTCSNFATIVALWLLTFWLVWLHKQGFPRTVSCQYSWSLIFDNMSRFG